uniref:Pyruvate dehydrogenase E1 component subunit alpha n=2 Tax=Parascaris univalens TaxID=6257 RepID=A0A915A048_PARUN
MGRFAVLSENVEQLVLKVIVSQKHKSLMHRFAVANNLDSITTMSIVGITSKASIAGRVRAAYRFLPPLISQRFASSTRVKVKPYKLHNIDFGPNAEVTVTRDDTLKIYTRMQTIRRLEAAAGNLYKEQKIRGFCHLYAGEEACAVGIKSAMEPDDAIITSYRCHGWTYLCGPSVVPVLCELTGRMNGNVHGKGGSMHMYGHNFYGGNGIVGAQQPLGTGVAFAMKCRKMKNVCFTLFGDGAANQGQLFESMNIAKLWNIPVVYVCENNGYGFGTSTKRACAAKHYYDRVSYMPGVWVDGMDVLAVREAARWAKEWCNGGKGPLILEMSTYRYGGHSVADPGTSYRTRDEVEEVRRTRDAINAFKEKVITAGLVAEDELKEIDRKIRKEVDEAAKMARTGKEATTDLLLTDLYHNTPPQVVRCTTDYVRQPYTNSSEACRALG